MGVLTFGLIVYLVKKARQRFSKAAGDDLAMDHNKDRHGKPQDRNMDTRWADGLRGIAAVGVVSSHICLAFWQQLITPTVGGTDGTPMLFQRPILRLVIQGQAFVALFFILMGFVNSLKPLRQAQMGQTEEAHMSLAKSSLTRSARLVLPAVVITCFAWLACQLGLNEVARRSGAFWLYDTSRLPSSTWWAAFTALRDALVQTWVAGENPYEQPQWALKWLLMGSFWIFLVLFTTTTTRPIFRLCVLATLYTYSWVSADFLLGTNIYFGIFLAQIHTLLASPECPPILKRSDSTLTRFLPFFTALLGLYFMSFPSGFAADASWSRDLSLIAAKIAPGAADVPRLWTSIGAQFLCASIYFSPPLKSLLSHRIPCYLGGVSFSMYLLHGPLVRSILAWMVFGPAAMRGELKEIQGALRYPIPEKWTLFFILPIFGVILMACVHTWAIKVEPIFARMTKALERLAEGDKEGPKSPLPFNMENSKRRDSVQERPR